MIEWDDYYQALRAKNKNIDIRECLESFKNENDVFYADWNEAERKGKFAYSFELNDREK